MRVDGLVLMLCVLSMSCATTKPIALPGSLREQADRYTVGGHVTLLQRTLRFGPYSGTSAFIYKSEDHRPATLLNGQRERFEASQKGRIVLNGSSGTYRVKCEHAQAGAIQHEKSLDYQRIDGEGGFLRS